MSRWLSIPKRLVPHQLSSFVRAAHRDFVFWRAMKRLLKDPDACKHSGNPILIDLIYGWGNEYWSAQDEYLAVCIDYALSTRGPILECGSGLSTIVIGTIAKSRGLSH